MNTRPLNEISELLQLALKKMGCVIDEYFWGDDYVNYTDYMVLYEGKEIAGVDTLDNEEYEQKYEGVIEMCFEALEWFEEKEDV